MLISYALSSLRFKDDKKNNKTNSKDNESYNYYASFSTTLEQKVVIELNKYDITNVNTIKVMIDLIEKNNLNAKMLIAVDIWYKGNNRPSVFDPSMFTKENTYFSTVMNISFDNNKIPHKEFLITFINYANFIKNSLYKSPIQVKDSIDSGNDSYEYYENESEY